MKIGVIFFIFLLPFFFISQNLDKAITLSQKGQYLKSNQILNKIKPQNKEEKSAIFYYLAENNYFLGNLDSSIYFVTQSIKSNLKENELKSKSYTLLGAVYTDINEINLAENFYFKSLEIRKKTNDFNSIGKCYNNIGGLYFSQSKYEKANFFFKKALKLFHDKTDLNYQITLSNIGASYIQLSESKKALPYIKESQVLAIKLEDKLGESIAINNLATIYRDLNEKDSALFYYQKALQMVDELGSKEEKKTILLNLSEIYEAKGNINEAFNYFKQHTILKEELFNIEKNEFIVETQEKYDATERKKEIAELKLREQKKDARFMQMIYVIIICSILLVFLGLILFFRIRWKNIQAKNKSKLELISATFEAEEKERQRISQDIHDELGGLLGISRMLFTQTKKYLSDVNLELYTRVDELLVQANIRSRSLSHELFSPTLKQFGLYPAINEYLQNIQAIHLDLIIEFEMKESRLDPQIELNLFRITQELITNTIKYAQAQKISLRIDISENKLKYTYFDDGIGFDDKTVKKGVGLNSISDRVQRFNGEISLKSEQNKGFEVQIIIPFQIQEK